MTVGERASQLVKDMLGNQALTIVQQQAELELLRVEVANLRTAIKAYESVQPTGQTNGALSPTIAS
jgi:hypothetical protein